MIKVHKDLTGKIFGRLIVIRQIDDYISPKGFRKSQWLCNCKCGNTDICVIGSDLSSGKIKSCGCYKKENIAKRNRSTKKKYNKYDLSGEYGIGYTLKGEEFYFDLDDYDKIKDYCWWLDCHKYVVSEVKGTKIIMHKLIVDCFDHFEVDHKNHKEFDNRKTNLRVCSHLDNMKNQILGRNNKSGITGVEWHKATQKWMARICVNGESKYLGVYSNIKDAINVRKQAEEKYFREYSYDNSIKINRKDGEI